jgi:hypothetical protein
VALTTGTARAQSIYVQGPPPPPPPPPPQYYGPPPGQYYGPPPPRYAYYAPDYEPPQALALGFDLEGAFPVNLPVIDGNTIQGGGGGFKVRIGEQFHLRPRLRITPEAGYSYDHLWASDNSGNNYDWDMHRIFAGARLSFGHFIAPALYGHIGYGWWIAGDSGVPQAGGFAWDVGAALDFRFIPHLGLGVHVEYDELDSNPYAPEWVTFGGHADIIF